jgi:enoyl-CoA hydratase/carnithine racemase/3-hydroxyacyl-CoA dehydrogenase
MTALRQPTTETLGLGPVIDFFKNGKLPVTAASLVDTVFGKSGKRGAMVISGANGIVGAGKTMQLGSRLQPFGIPVVGLDFPGAPDGIGRQYPGLKAAFGPMADDIMAGIIRLNYDGRHLPKELKGMNPRFLLEAIPEILEIKKAHYGIFQEAFSGIEIKSVTSGFPSSELGVGIAHPAFPHEINKTWEIVETKTSPTTQLFWALGLIPMPVSDHWSFVLDVLFCGLTLSGIRYHRAFNMPYWKIDKFVRKLLGPNPFRAHDAIGAAGANFLTWSCLHHLSKKYGDLFMPTPELEMRKESGQNWYPLNHFRPVVDWSMTNEENEEFESWIMGPMVQMTTLMVKEKRSHFAHINAIGELCAQFRKGVMAAIRNIGPDLAMKRVETYHKLHPKAADDAWYPNVLGQIESPEWQQLYVNAEHDGTIGVITIGRESYNSDVDSELNRAIDWLKSEDIDRVIVTGDFHLATQLVGADTSDFYPALSDTGKGYEISHKWSLTARRLHDEFKVSVGFINGKRCLGGMLELMMHCHFVLADEEARLGMPEVTLPVVPGMEGCHWPFRKTGAENWPKLLKLLLSGAMIKVPETTGWLIDFTGPLESCLQTAWKLAAQGASKSISKRQVVSDALKNVPSDIDLPDTGNPALNTARKAIMETIQQSCSCSLTEAVTVQAKYSAEFMVSSTCKKGMIGAEAVKVMNI